MHLVDALVQVINDHAPGRGVEVRLQNGAWLCVPLEWNVAQRVALVMRTGARIVTEDGTVIRAFEHSVEVQGVPV